MALKLQGLFLNIYELGHFFTDIDKESLASFTFHALTKNASHMFVCQFIFKKYFSYYALGGHYIRKGRKWRAAGRHKGSESGLSIILVSMIDAIILVFDRSFPLVR